MGGRGADHLAGEAIAFSALHHPGAISGLVADVMVEESILAFERSSGLLSLVGAPILVDAADYAGVKHAARSLAEDFGRVTRGEANPFQALPIDAYEDFRSNDMIIVGCIELSWILKKLEKEGKLDFSPVRHKWESFMTAVVDNPVEGCAKALVIAGSDKRAAIFGAYTLSKQIGVSP